MGQRCTASSRLIVTDGIYETFVDRMGEAMKELRVGDARAPDIQIGPVASEAQLEINKSYISQAEVDGATLASRSGQIDVKSPGYYFSPTLFTEVSPQSAIARDEIFGPIAAVFRVPDFDAALEAANDADFGLSSGIVTHDAVKIDYFTRNAEAGMVQVNLPTAGMDFHAPFTGRKSSSYGAPEKGSLCREFFTAAKVVHKGRG